MQEPELKFYPRRPTSGDKWPIESVVLVMKARCNEHESGRVWGWNRDVWLSIIESNVARQMERTAETCLTIHRETGCLLVPEIRISTFLTRPGKRFVLTNTHEDEA